jgi:beta-phosphoglucomutase-like phosphatase (HAD superfamily)/CMP-N-acetylneuraminic acid synthetase
MKVTAFVPLKLKSRRLPNKNFLRLGDRPLSYHIFETLTKVDSIDSVFCYTSQPQVLSLLPDEVELLMRPKSLDGDHVKANELFRYSIEHIDADIIVLCHATGPYIKHESITKGVEAVKSGEYDCAFAVQKLQTYAWFDNKPLNYNPTNMAQTQDLIPLFVETSGFYIFRKEDYLVNNTRIGKKPFFVEIDFKESIDIDDPEDFSLATALLDYCPVSTGYSTDNFFVDLVNNSSKLKNILHISFDLDGVLVDSLSVMESAWLSAMQNVDLNISFDDYKKHIGIPFDQILKLLSVPDQYHANIKNIYDKYSSESISNIKVFDGVSAAIKRAQESGLKISVVTSKTKSRTDEILKHHFPDINFDMVVSPEDIPSGRGKPYPDPILLACVMLGVDPYNTIYIGDMESDREASKRAGVHFVHAAWGYADLKNIKDLWFNNIDDLMDYILF